MKLFNVRCKRFLLPLILSYAFSFSLHARMPTSVEGTGKRTYDQFLFLWDRTVSAGQRDSTFHPFFTSYSNAEKSYRHKGVLFPLYYNHGTRYWSRWSMLFIFSGDYMYHVDKGKDEDVFSPLWYYGKGSDNERYFSFFPIGGVWKDKMGWEKLWYAGGILYVGWSYKDYRADNLIWPLFQYGRGKDRLDLRIWPFFSYKSHEGKYSHKGIGIPLIILPLIAWGSDDLDKKEPRHFFSFLNIFGRKLSDGGKLSSGFILWPLFSWGKDTKRESWNMNLFWFLYMYRYNKDPYIYMNLSVPFGGVYKYGDKDGNYRNEFRYALLWANLKTNSALVESDYNFLIPFYWNNHRFYKKEMEEENYLKVWPLFYRKEDSRGNYTFQTLALWPFRTDDFDRVWGPLWSLYEFKKFENNDRYYSLLFRLYSVYYNEEETRRFILGVTTHNSGQQKGFSVFGGLFGYHWGEKGRSVELLWFDL